MIKAYLKTAFQKALLILMGIIIGALLAEGVLRIHNPFEQRVKGYKISLPKNKQYVIKSKLISGVDPVVYHSRNSLGFLGAEMPENFNDYLTIITIGGSTTECFYLSDEKAWPGILAKMLKRDFHRVWYNNAGLDGHSTFGHYVLMQDYIADLKPKIGIFLIGANEIGREQISASDLQNIRNGLNFSSIKMFVKSAVHYSEVLSLVVTMYRYYSATRMGFPHYDVNFEEALKKLEPKKGEMLSEEIRQHKKKYLPGYYTRVKQLIEISRKNSIIPILITQPALYGDFQDPFTGLSFEITEDKWKIWELYNDVVRKIGQEENIMVIDLARKLPKSSLYYYDWMHCTNEGAAKIGEILYFELSPFLAKAFPQLKKTDL